MAKVIKNIKVNWNWNGDTYSLIQFNVAITPKDENPNTKIVITSSTSSTSNTYTFMNVVLDDTVQYTAWVQACYEGKDGDWINAGNLTVSDDGTATVATTNSVNTAIEGVQTQIDTANDTINGWKFTGKTTIDGGKIETDSITSAQIKAGQITVSKIDPNVQSTLYSSSPLTVNTVFSNWTGTYPYGFSAWNTAPTKETTLVRSGLNSARFKVTATGQQHGMYINPTAFIPNISNQKYLYIEIGFMLVSGSLAGAGALMDWNGMSPYRNTIALASYISSPTLNQWYTLKTVIQRPTDTQAWTTTLTSAVSAGATSISVASGANLISNQGSIAIGSENINIGTVSGNTINLKTPLANAYAINTSVTINYYWTYNSGYLMANYSGIGDGVKDIVFDSFLVREPSQQEIDLYANKTSWNSATSTVNSNSTNWNTAYSLANGWKYSNTTFIDGGDIYTGTITADKITVGAGSVANGNLASASVVPNRLWTSNSVSSTTLSVASSANATTITLTALPITAIGATVMIGSEVKTITAVNTSTKVVTLNSALTNAYAVNTTVNLFDGTLLSDGNKTVGTSYTGFNSGTSNNNGAESYYIQLDLGTTYRIAESRAFFYSGDTRYYWYKIKYSTDGTNWYYAVGNSSNTGWSISAPSNNGQPSYNPTIDKFSIPITARYIRLYGNGNNVNAGNHVYEWELYSTGQTIIDGGQIITGTMTADRISGGTLTLGGSSNGSMYLKNSSNNDVARMTTSGIEILQGGLKVVPSYGSSGSFITLNNGITLSRPDISDPYGGWTTTFTADNLSIGYATGSSVGAESSFKINPVYGQINVKTKGLVGWDLQGYSMQIFDGTLDLANVALNVANLTVAKNGNYSTISFPAQNNDPGLIQHVEFDNTAEMRFCVSDDFGQIDNFVWGSTSNGWTPCTRLYTNGYFYTVGWIETEGWVKAERFTGHSSRNFYIGDGSTGSRIDAGDGGFRLYTSWIGNADYGLRVNESGGIDVLVNNSTKFSVSSSGSKTGGTFMIDGIDYGMSPMDSPRSLIEDLYFDIDVEEVGTTINLDVLYSKMIANYAVFCSNNKVEIVSKDATSFTVKGYTGKVDIRVIGVRKDLTDYYYPIMNDTKN